MSFKIALVLGGGGSRGLAHVGVLKVLQREGLPIDLIVGTSMGGMVGVLFSLGHSPDQIAEGLQQTMGLTYTNGSVFNNVKLISSRIRQRRLGEQLTPILKDKTFADLKIPVILMTVDMISGQEVALTEGPLIPALLATMAVPGVFPPVNMDGRQLADGGVIDSTATHIAYEQGAGKIIAVDVYPALETENPWNDPVSAVMGFQLPITWLNSTDDNDRVIHPNMFSSMWRAVRVMTWHLHQTRLADHPPDILMRPDVDHYGSLDFKDKEGPIRAGFAEAERHLEAIRALKETPPVSPFARFLPKRRQAERSA
jgi:NTE family protein